MKLSTQKQLMIEALAKLDEIGTIKRYLEKVDPLRCNLILDDLKKDYADIMSKLTEGLVMVGITN